MLSNFIRVSLRYLAKNRVYTIINVVGLALGIACFVLLTLFVQKELSYDKFHEQKELVYQLYAADSGKVELEYNGNFGKPAGSYLVETVPELESFARFGRISDIVVRADGNKYILPQLHYSDAAAFNMFDINLLNMPNEQLKLEKGQIVMSASEAERLYGNAAAAIGREFEIVDLDVFEVVAVFEDIPAESHLEFEYVVSFESYVKQLLFFKSNFTFDIDIDKWGAVSAFPTYFKMREGAHDLAAVELKIQEALKVHQNLTYPKLVRLDDIYFSDYYNGYFKDAGDMSQIQLYSIVAMVLLLIAIVNYTNMATARYSKRSKEVGIRKTIGGHRSQVIKQFLTESFVMVFFAMILAVCIAEMAMPFFNNYTGKEIDISYSSPLTYMSFLVLSVFIGMIAGLYPSFYLSRFSPLQNLNGQSSGRRGNRFRQVLVGFQFATCLTMMAVTGIVFSQFNHMQNMDKGFDDDRLVRIELRDPAFAKQYATFKEELLSSPYVEKAAGASISFDGVATFYVDINEEKKGAPVSFMLVEREFIEMLGVEMIDGEIFADMQPSETKGKIIVNQHLVEEAGWENAVGQELDGRKVAGVVKDFIYGSAKEEIAPLMIMENSSNDHSSLFVRITGNTKEAIKFLESKHNQFATEHPFDYEFLDELFAKKYRAEQMLSQVLGIFSGLTIFIAGLGILGLSIFVAEQRIKEIGIRRVLGASLGQIVWLLNSSITKLILIIAIVILPAVYYFIQGWLNNFAFTISLNGLYFVLPLLLLIGIVWGILFYQSMRSANSNPVNALRTE